MATAQYHQLGVNSPDGYLIVNYKVQIFNWKAMMSRSDAKLE